MTASESDERLAGSQIGNLTSKAGMTQTSGYIQRRGFEGYAVYSPTQPGASFQYGPAGGAGAFEGAAGVSENNTYLTSGSAPAPEGTRVGFVQSGGRMTETVTGLTIGEAYRVAFKLARRVNYG